jgi:putative transposase
MTSSTTPSSLALVPSLETAWQDVNSSFERFCLTAGIGAIEQMLREDAEQLAGAPHTRSEDRVGHPWGRTKGKLGFHGGKVVVHRPRVRSFDGREIPLPTWTAGAGRGLAWSVGDEPDADQRVDAQAQARGAAA